MKMKIDKNKLKYRLIAVVITLSVVLSYVAVFNVDVHADNYNIDRSQLVAIATATTKDGPYRLYKTRQYLEKVDIRKVYALYRDDDLPDGTLNVSARERVPSDTGLTWLETQTWSDSLQGGTESNPNSFIPSRGWYGQFYGVYSVSASVYIFDSLDHCDKYLNGQLSETEVAKYAENYNEVAFGNAEYDSSVPSPDKLYIDSLSSTSVSAVWSYTDGQTSLDNVTYKVEVENFYVTTSLFNSIAKGWTGKTGESSWKFNGTIDECNRLKGMGTVEAYLSSPTKVLADEVLVSSNVISDSGAMHSTNTYVCTPTDYSGKFASSGNAFFTGATNSHWAEYCGSQVTVTPYMTVDGVTKKGASVVCRRFTSDMLNTIIGSTYTKVGTDSTGKEYIESTNRQDNTGTSSGEYEKLDTDNVMEFIKNGFGILGNNGVIALAQTVFLGIPAYIWMLYGTLVAVTIVVIVFKIVRGF